MNIMKPIYDLTDDNLEPNHRLGIALWVGKCINKCERSPCTQYTFSLLFFIVFIQSKLMLQSIVLQD